MSSSVQNNQHGQDESGRMHIYESLLVKALSNVKCHGLSL